MSMNLCFEVKKCDKCHRGPMVDFPFQTPTELTWAVLRAEGNDARLKLIQDQLEKWKWSIEDINRTMEEITTLINDPTLELSYI